MFDAVKALHLQIMANRDLFADYQALSTTDRLHEPSDPEAHGALSPRARLLRRISSKRVRCEQHRTERSRAGHA
jgi:hypothetical protein